VEKVRGWFGTPVAAGKTLLWLCWVSFLVSLLIGLLYLLALGALAACGNPIDKKLSIGLPVCRLKGVSGRGRRCLVRSGP
jgi:hypothetical protein